ncbi:Proteinase inhibitor I4, serpin (fragment) [Kamptonema sp. PCC 6506]
MTYNGASGETQQAMAKALELQGLDLNSLNQANADLITALIQADPTVNISLVNSLWAKQGVPFKPEFIQKTQTFYSAEANNLDFTNPKSPDTINNWVKHHTCGKISQIIKEIPAGSELFLINAVYFKGDWTDKFDKGDTKNKPFTLVDGSTKQYSLMSRTGWYDYYETPEFQAISIPYGNGRFSLYVFLPQKTSNLSQFYQTLTPENWEKSMQKFTKQKVTIELPRFKLEYEIKLNGILKSLGMGVAFDEKQADFSGMRPIPPNLYISEVKHKTFVELKEEGTEAAAITSIQMSASPIPLPHKPFEMIVDSPFFSAIHDNQTETILFMGSIVEPN